MDENVPCRPSPGEGLVLNVRVSLHEGTIDAIRAWVGEVGFSAFVEEAVLRQIHSDNLRELVEDHTSRYGEFTPEERDRARALLFGTDEEQRGSAA